MLKYHIKGEKESKYKKKIGESSHFKWEDPLYWVCFYPSSFSVGLWFFLYTNNSIQVIQLRFQMGN